MNKVTKLDQIRKLRRATSGGTELVKIDIPLLGMSLAEWIDHGKHLKEIESATPWAWGDWWNAQDRKWGEAKELAEKVGIEYRSANRYGQVASTFQLGQRCPNLTWWHHLVSLKLPASLRIEWLRDAEENGTSAQELRRKIRHFLKGIGSAKKLALALGTQKTSVLYADPPWKYNNTGFEGAAEDHYPPMSIEELCAMPVAQIMTSDSVLFLWATNPLLPGALDVMEAWGFEYKTAFVWVKDKPMNSLGFYNRSQHELLLLGTRGSMTPEGAVRALPTSIITAKKQEHSRKPVEAYELIEGLYGRFIPVMRELFCRGKGRSGWQPPFGNQVQ